MPDGGVLAMGGNQWKWPRRPRLVRATAVLLLLGCEVAWGQAPQSQKASQSSPSDLTQVSIENLMNMEVTSASKKEQKLSRVASAIFVVSQEDIRRSGATNIPDLLRIVPGLNVAQIDASVWAISARGFNGEFSNKLLVMLDGRSVYLPTFSGVFWDVLDVPLEDIERIEVIRGPGGTTWGANAVNGVIDIITKKASQTRGGMVVAGGGNLNQGFGTVQYGGGLGKNTDYRIFTKYLNEYHHPDPSGQKGGDGWHALRGGFRTDSKPSTRDDLTLQGDLYSTRVGSISGLLESVASPITQFTFTESNVAGGYIQGDWYHRYSERSDTTLQVSFDNYERNDALREKRNTANIDFEHHFALGTRQDLVWGLGYRYSSSTTNGNLTISLDPADLDTQLFSAFVQDEIALIPEKLSLTAGTKLEHNYYTGFGVMPSARVAWNLKEDQMVWAAVSRAIRTPSSLDTAARFNTGGFVPPGGAPVLIRITGNPAFQDERLIAYEAGYRAKVFDRLTMDFAAYYNSYGHLETTEPFPPLFESTPLPPHVVLPLVQSNLMHGETHGIEISANWKVSGRWTLAPGYAFEQIHLHLDPTSQDSQSIANGQGSSPRHWARLDSHVNLARSLAWDASANFVGRLPAQNLSSYTRLDTQLTWRPGENFSFSMVGQNLVKDRHLEFLNLQGSALSSMTKRNAYAKLTWQF